VAAFLCFLSIATRAWIVGLHFCGFLTYFTRFLQFDLPDWLVGLQLDPRQSLVFIRRSDAHEIRLLSLAALGTLACGHRTLVGALLGVPREPDMAAVPAATHNQQAHRDAARL
jgi:hypothetical protein